MSGFYILFGGGTIDGIDGQLVRQENHNIPNGSPAMDGELARSRTPFETAGKKWLGGGLVDMSEADLATLGAWQAAQADAAEHARGAALAPTIGEQVTTLAGLLEAFGLYMPLDFAEAMATMYAASKAANDKTPDALMALIIYQGLREHFTDRDIYLVARHLGLTQEEVAE